MCQECHLTHQAEGLGVLTAGEYATSKYMLGATGVLWPAPSTQTAL
jgi:hypothetical protein